MDEVPSYQKLMLPVLQLAADGTVRSTADAFEPISAKIGLSEKGRHATLPDGRNRLRHRLEWARTYLKKAGLLEYPRRGTFQITARGKQILGRNLAEINSEVLSEFPEFRIFKNSNREEELPARAVEDVDPEEAFENAHVALRKGLEDELLDKVKTSSPSFLEQLVIDLLLSMGYGGSRKDAGRALGKSGDGGIDGIINEDALGLDVVYVQAKRWTGATVGRPDIQAFVGALQGNRARKGVFITTSTFSKDAHDYIQKIDARVVLIDGSKLASLMADHNIGVTNGRQYVIKRIDNDYFSEE